MNTNLIGLSGKIGSGKDTVAEIIRHLSSSPGLSNGTIAHFVQQHSVMSNKGEYQVKKFAGKLKQIASILTGIPVDKFEDQDFKNQYLDELGDPSWNYYCIMAHVDQGSDMEYVNERHMLKSTADDSVALLSDSAARMGFELYVEHNRMTVRQLLQELGTEAMRNGLHPNAWVNALMSEYRAPKMSEDYPSKWLITDVRFENEAEAIKERDGILVRVKRNASEYSGSHPSETALDHYKFDYTIDNNGSMVDLVAAVRSFLEAYDIINADTYAD